MTPNEATQIKDLEKEGWTKRFTIEVDRVDEYIALYESLGYQVHVGPVIPSEREDCQACYELKCERYKTIYTK